MLLPRQALCSVALLLLVATGAVAQTEVRAELTLPDWLRSRIAKMEAMPKYAEATTIWKITYKNEDAFLFFAPCCDQYNPLYSATGALLCSPSGGIVGRGDGMCPDAVTPKTKFVVVWRKPEASKK